MNTPVSTHPSQDDPGLQVFVIGITGSIGSRLARRLLTAGVRVRGLVRTAAQGSQWVARGAAVEVADLTSSTVPELATMLRGVTTIVYAAGSNGGAKEVTDAIDAEGVAKTVAAANQAQVREFILVSVMPEAWRDRDLDEDEEYYFATKKRAEVLLSRSDLDWVILRPSLLLDEPGTGRVSMGPAEVHRGVPRDDVAEALAGMVLEYRAGRQILELDRGDTPVSEALRRSVFGRRSCAHQLGASAVAPEPGGRAPAPGDASCRTEPVRPRDETRRNPDPLEEK